jgi:hypothetical protein
MLLLPFTRGLILVLLKQDDILHLLRCDTLSKWLKTELSSLIFLKQIISKLNVQRINVYATNITQYEHRFLFSEVSESNEIIRHTTVTFLVVNGYFRVFTLHHCADTVTLPSRIRIELSRLFFRHDSQITIFEKYISLYKALQQKCVTEN